MTSPVQLRETHAADLEVTLTSEAEIMLLIRTDAGGNFFTTMTADTAGTMACFLMDAALELKGIK